MVRGIPREVCRWQGILRVVWIRISRVLCYRVVVVSSEEMEKMDDRSLNVLEETLEAEERIRPHIRQTPLEPRRT